MREDNRNTLNDLGSDEIIIHSIKRKKSAIINGDVAVFPLSEGITRIEVGNTGLQLSLIDTDDGLNLTGDFMPEGKMDPGQVHPLKAMSILSYSLVHLRNFLKGQREIDTSKVRKLVSNTNRVFAEFLTRLCHSGEHPELITHSSDSYGTLVYIDIKKFVDLPDGDPLIQKMVAFSNRAEGKEIGAMIRE